MTRAEVPTALHELCNPSSPEAQVDALKQLKNDIVGHDQRKEFLVRYGIVRPLVRILEGGQSKGGKRRRMEAVGHSTDSSTDIGINKWSVHEEIRLQAIMVLGSLALAGPAFVAPLIAGSVLIPLLDILSQVEQPPRMVIPILRTLNNIAESLNRDQPLTDSVDPSLRQELIKRIYTNGVISGFVEIFSQQRLDGETQTAVTLTARLISQTCTSEAHQNMLVKARVLDSLGSRLAITLKHQKRLTTAPFLSNGYTGDAIGDLLDAVGTIIQGSNYRTARFLYSHAMIDLTSTGGMITSSNRTMPSEEGQPSFTSLPPLGSFDNLGLPRLEVSQSKAEQSFSKAFPPLGSLIPNGSEVNKLHFSDVALIPPLKLASGEKFESPVFNWLIHIARSYQSHERLAAIWVLSLLKRFTDSFCPDEGFKNRERAIAFLIVPLLVQMIDDANTTEVNTSSKTVSHSLLHRRTAIERAPTVLAILIEESPVLQKAAVEAGIIKRLCQMLKKTFDPARTSMPLWSPQSNLPSFQDNLANDQSSTLGRPGFPFHVVHALRCRTGILRALSAIADKEDAYRKAMIETGVIACIIDSLVPYPERVFNGDYTDINASSKDGNPIAVLVAACNAARSLSRSVGILRTSLIDYGIAKPILQLLNHRDVTVQVASTEVLCNLLLHFSPMRDDILEAGSLKTLCAHAHSANMAMRLNSLWALKHLVLTATNDVKINCLEELGTGWLIQALSGDLRDFPFASRLSRNALTPLGMGTANAAGEQVDILNTSETPQMEIDSENGIKMEPYSAVRDISEGPCTWSVTTTALQAGNLYSKISPYIEERLKMIQIMEQDPAVKARKDELRIQEQALDFIRNLISESKGNATEMIDHLLAQIGTTQFFEIMKDKLVVRISNPSQSEFLLNSKARSEQQFGQPAELLLATLFVLIHIANGKPSHRSLLISQKHMLSPLLRLFDHPDRRIRVALAWLINNLTWMDDQSDLDAARKRARDLREAGFEGRVRQLLQDGDLDTRERAKTAVEQIAKLLDGDSSLEIGNVHGSGAMSGIIDRSHRGWDP